MKKNILRNKYFDEIYKNQLITKIEAKKENYYQKTLNAYRYDKDYKHLHTFALLGSSYFQGKYNFSPNVATFIASFPSKKNELKSKLAIYIHSVKLYNPSPTSSNIWEEDYYPGAEEVVKRYKFAKIHTAGFKDFIAGYNKAFGFNNDDNRYQEISNYYYDIDKKIKYYEQRAVEEANASEKRYKRKMCDECKIDYSKTKIPKDEKRLLGTYRESGIIQMVNGSKYEWDYSDSGYRVPALFSSKHFDSFNEMLEYFLKKCEERHCN